MAEIYSQSFLTQEQRERISSQVIKLRDKYQSWNSEEMSFLGNPIYVDQIRKRDSDISKIKALNLIIEEHFSDLLKETQSYLSRKFQSHFFYHPDLSYPGFHILNVPSREEIYFNYHWDDEYLELMNRLPDFKLDISFKSQSFTVLISSGPDSEDGLLYVENFAFLEKVRQLGMREQDTDKKLLRTMSSYHSYSLGDISIHHGYLHAIHSKNRSQDACFRITFQGHFSKTDKGYVIYW